MIIEDVMKITDCSLGDPMAKDVNIWMMSSCYRWPSNSDHYGMAG